MATRPSPQIAELVEALSDLRKAAIRAEQAAAYVVEEIDPSFPGWHRTGEPTELSPQLRDALVQLGRLVELHHAVIQEAMALGRRVSRSKGPGTS